MTQLLTGVASTVKIACDENISDDKLFSFKNLVDIPPILRIFDVAMFVISFVGEENTAKYPTCMAIKLTGTQNMY